MSLAAVQAVLRGLTVIACLLALTYVPDSRAATTTFLSAGSTCGGGNSVNFSEGGSTVQVSLCVSTTAEGVCGVSVFPNVNGAANDGRFKIMNRTLGTAVPDPSSPITFPVDLNNTPNYLLNFGGSRSTPTAPAAAANQLLATFDISPQPNATSANYTFGLDAFSELNTAIPGTNCFTNFSSEFISPTMTFVRGTAPQFTSDVSATVTVTFPATFTFTANGSPAPSFSITAGNLPTGMTLAPATGVISGTPQLGMVGIYPVTLTATNGNLPNATQNFTLIVQKANQAINFASLGDRAYSATLFAVSATVNSGLTVTFSSATLATCSVSGTSVTMLATGTCTLVANQTGNINYNAAAPVPQSFQITGLGPYPVTPSAGANGTISPSTPVAVNNGNTTTFTVTPNAGYTASVGGSCGGNLVGTTYTTNAIIAACTIAATFTLNTYPITPSAGANGTINPSTPQTISYGATTTFTVTPSAGYVASVGGSCGGALAGTTYTTAIITAPCTVIASFTLNTYTVAPSAGSNGGISPNTPQAVNYGAATSFTVTPNPGFYATVGGTCGGSLVANTFTTNAITANCTVDATFASALSLVSIESRKTHGALGPFFVALDKNLALGDAIPVEPRSIGAGHLIVFTFDSTVTDFGSVTVTDATPSPVGNATLSRLGNEVRVTLTGIPDNKRVMISLSGVNGSASASAPLGFLVGDVSGSRSVNASDISAVKAHLNQTANGSNFRSDVNATGIINSVDVTVVKARSGAVMP